MTGKLFLVDSCAGGISLERKVLPGKDVFIPGEYPLSFHGQSGGGELRSRYVLQKSDPFRELELQLLKLSREGDLRKSLFLFGVGADPFLSFSSGFDSTMRFLELFQKYVPGKLIIQTRSPLVVLAMPALRSLGSHVSVSFGLETVEDSVVQQLSPMLPGVKERLKAIRTLRHFGIAVGLQVAPLLPYGDRIMRAEMFAEILVEYGDYITLNPLVSDESESCFGSEFLQRVSGHFGLEWLRSDADFPLRQAIEQLAPGRIGRQAALSVSDEQQIDLFAA